MFRIRSGEERGKTRLPWLDSRHTFAFGNFHDSEYQGFRCLRVINDDRVSPGAGFGSHSHQNMEIVSYVLDGKLAHEDSTGHEATLEPGDVQRMSAGRGVRHSEFNPSQQEYTRFLQIWIMPKDKNIEPEYEQKHFAPDERRGGLELLVAPDRVAPDQKNGLLHIHQDVHIFRARLSPQEDVQWRIPRGRFVWLQVVGGDVTVNDAPLSEGDGVALDHLEETVEVVGKTDSEVLLFDLP